MPKHLAMDAARLPQCTGPGEARSARLMRADVVDRGFAASCERAASRQLGAPATGGAAVRTAGARRQLHQPVRQRLTTRRIAAAAHPGPPRRPAWRASRS
jgi:hypothetical protein